MAAKPLDIDPDLLRYCAPQQHLFISDAIELGSLYAAEKKRNLSVGSGSKILTAVRKKAAKYGHAPAYVHHNTNLPGFSTKRVSTARKPDGSTALEWHIQEPEKEQQAQALRDFVDGLNKEINQIKPTLADRTDYNSELMPSIFIGDAHIGMRAFGKETKHHDFDTEIATNQLRTAADYLIDKAEPAKIGMLVDVGDYTHADGHSDTTTAGTALDVDTRHRSTMYQAALTMRYMIGKMLTRCEKVIVVIARGNHNDNVAPAIELMLAFAYENEPRVQIVPTNGYTHYVEYGKWLFGITHGDKQKPEALAGSMARDMPEAWGRTTHRLWCTGHYHKEAVKTLPGCKHKVFAALPPPDSWHASHGFSGDGEMEMMTFRKSGGVHSSHVYNIPRPIVEPDVRIA